MPRQSLNRIRIPTNGRPGAQAPVRAHGVITASPRVWRSRPPTEIDRARSGGVESPCGARALAGAPSKTSNAVDFNRHGANL